MQIFVKRMFGARINVAKFSKRENMFLQNFTILPLEKDLFALNLA